VTRNQYGNGTVTYMGTILSDSSLRALFASEVVAAEIVTEGVSFPLVMRGGVNKYGKPVRYYFNYSGASRRFFYGHSDAVDLLTGERVSLGDSVSLGPWGVAIMEETGRGKWMDTDGQRINAHGAGVLYHDGVYYLFGEIKKGPTRLVPGKSWEDYRVEAGGVSCYSSRDLVHWKNEGVTLAADPRDTASDLYSGRVIERPKVIYNERTGKYVMWMHIDRDDYGFARAGVAVASRPGGPYRYIGSYRPNGQMSRDMTVYKDPADGRAYLVYASENNNTMQVCLLSEDYLKPTGVYKRILIGQRREAPAVFRNGGRYYLITSLCSGWDPNAARYAVADSMLGEWRQMGNPCVGVDSSTTFHSQSTFVLPVNGGYLFMADRWNKTNLEGSGYLWLPLRVEKGRVEIRDTSALDHRYEIGGLALVDYKMRIRGDSGYSFL